jgi:hypothetical protein
MTMATKQSRREREISERIGAIRMVRTGDYNLKITPDARDQMIADLTAEVEMLVVEAFEAEPETFAKFPDGRWGLRKHLKGPTLAVDNKSTS